MMMQMLGAFAEFERAMIRERTREGLKSAAAAGRIGGRRPKLRADQKAEAIRGVAEGRRAADYARLFNVSRSTVSRAVKASQVHT
jgi:DNA invertase Pin-like site-specific DNA recombinase